MFHFNCNCNSNSVVYATIFDFYYSNDNHDVGNFDNDGVVV